MEKRKDGSYNQPLFANAILKYGWDNFEHKILYTGLTKEEANKIEKELVAKWREVGLSYNITRGGEGVAKYATDEEAAQARKEGDRRRGAKYRAAHKDEIKERRDSKKEQKAEYDKEYRKTHKEQRRSISAKYRETHIEQERTRCLIKQKKYYAEHRDEINAKKRAKRAAAKQLNNTINVSIL